MRNQKIILIRDIENTFDKLLDELSKFDVKTFNEVPFEGSWTAGQTAEHIIICSSGIPDKNTVNTNRPFNEKVDAIKDLFLDFELKFKSHPSMSPGLPPHDREVLVQKIEGVKNNLKSVARTTDLEVLCMDMELPSFGHLTRYEWLRFILYHTQRHTHQIQALF